MRRIAAKSGDVLPHPCERGDLVHQSVVARGDAIFGRELRKGQEAQRSEPVFHGHDDHALVRQWGQVERLLMRAPGSVAASVEENHNR